MNDTEASCFENEMTLENSPIFSLHRFWNQVTAQRSLPSKCHAQQSRAIRLHCPQGNSCSVVDQIAVNRSFVVEWPTLFFLSPLPPEAICQRHILQPLFVVLHLYTVQSLGVAELWLQVVGYCCQWKLCSKRRRTKSR